MSNFLMPVWVLTDPTNNNVPVPGGKVYFFQNGTTTPLATYSNESLTSANTNPVVADGDAVVGRIYLQDELYTVEIRDASDNVIHSEDNVRGSGLLNASVDLRLRTLRSSPLDYGAIGDGVSNEASQLNQAIGNSSRVVDLGGKVYRCDSEIALTEGDISIENGTVDFSNTNLAACIYTVAGYVGITSTTASVGAGDTTITLADATGFSVGDLIAIRDSDTPWSTGVDAGEMAKISSISGNDITIERPLRSAYDGAVAVESILSVKNVSLKNITLILNPSQASTGDAIHLHGVDGLVLENVTIETPKGVGVQIWNCHNVRAKNVRVNYGLSQAIEQLGYGLDIDITHTHSNNTVGGISICEPHVPNDGVTYGISLRNSTVIGDNSGFVGINIGPAGEEVLIDGGLIEGPGVATSSDGIVAECSDIVIRNVAVRDINGSGVEFTPNAVYGKLRGIRVKGCVFENIGNSGSGYGVLAQAGNGTIEGIKVTDGCEFKSISGTPFFVSEAATHMVVFSGCEADNIYSGVCVDVTVSNIRNVVVSDNFLRGVGGGDSAVDITLSTGVATISNNVIDIPSRLNDSGIYLLIGSSSTAGLRSAAVINGNTVIGDDDAESSGNCGIDVYGTGTTVAKKPTLVMTGNNVLNCFRGIRVNGSWLSVVESGNSVTHHGTTAASRGIYLDGDSSPSDIETAAVSGNAVYGFDYSFGQANATENILDGNTSTQAGTGLASPSFTTTGDNG